MTYNTKTGKENTKEMGYNNSSGRFRPRGSRVMPYLSNATPWPLISTAIACFSSFQFIALLR